jgi:hypothetical protein
MRMRRGNGSQGKVTGQSQTCDTTRTTRQGSARVISDPWPKLCAACTCTVCHTLAMEALSRV